MKAEITFEQVWYNSSLLNFFFRSQAEKTLNELMDAAKDRQSALNAIEDYADTYDCDLDEIEEMFYNDSIEELAESFGIEIEKEDEEEDETDGDELPWWDKE